MIDNNTNNNAPMDSRLLGQQNEIMILRMLREHKRLSQSQLCRLAAIKTSTASSIVARLREKGFVTETRGISSNRGPKPIILELNPNSRFIFAVEINPGYILLGLVNFLGELVDKIRIALGHDHSVKHVTDLLTINVPGMLNKNNIENDKVLGLGLTLSGSVLPDGTVTLSSPMAWNDIPLKQNLQPFFGFPVFIYNNRVRLLAEIAHDPDLARRNILYLNTADGVGSTVYMDGKLVFGATGRYGETGHIVIDPNGPKCGCGNIGCLEAFVSGPALIEKIRKDLEAGSADCFKNQLDKQEASTTPEEILSNWHTCIEKKNPYALSLCDFASEHISNIAAMLINCYDPDIVMLAGYVSEQIHDTLAEKIRQLIKTSVYESDMRNIEIVGTRIGKNALIIGVTNAVLNEPTIFT